MRLPTALQVLHFELTQADMAALDALDERLFTEWEEWGKLDPTTVP